MENGDFCILPVIVSIAERPHWDGERLPHWIQCVLHHLCFMADSKPTAPGGGGGGGGSLEKDILKERQQ